jgi:hypothetical protein
MTTRRQSFRGTALACGLALLLAGCPKTSKEGQPKTPTPAGPQGVSSPTPPPGGGGNPIIPGGGPGVMAGRGAGTKTDARNQIYQIATAYNQFYTENGRGPGTQEEFMEYIKTFGKEYQSMKEGYFYIVPNVQPASMVIIAYESKPDSMGRHFVAMGDRQITALTTQELKAALGMK